MLATIKAKLIAFGTGIIFLIAIMSYLSITGLKNVKEKGSEIKDNYLVNIVNLNYITEHLYTIVIDGKSHIMAQNDEDMKLADKRIANNFKEVDKYIIEVQKTLTNEEDMKIFKTFFNEYQNYQKINKQVLEYSWTNDSDSLATVLSNTKEIKSFRAMQGNLRLMMSNNIKAANVSSDEADALITQSNVLLYSLSAIILVIIIFVNFLLNRTIVHSLAAANDVISKLANGNLDVKTSFTKKNEIGVMLQNLNVMTGKIKEVIHSVIMASNDIVTASTTMNESSQNMLSGASQQAASAEEVSSSIEQMTASINLNTKNSKSTENLAINSSKNVEDSNESVSQTVSSMRTIIQKISIIGEISRQTNLLALNAAVEAARAGEHGRGFAVVATEVRKLAERSQEAADEIDTVSVEGMQLAENSGNQLQNIVPEIQETANMVHQITQVSMEQNSGAEQISSAIQELNNVIQQNVMTAEKMNSNTENLIRQAEGLKEIVSFFQKKDEGSIEKFEIIEEKK